MMLHMRHPVDESLERFMWRTQTKMSSSHNRHTRMSCKATATKIITASQNMMTIMAKKRHASVRVPLDLLLPSRYWDVLANCDHRTGTQRSKRKQLGRPKKPIGTSQFHSDWLSRKKI